ncbi:MAG: Gfo/Idh/MocA family oxidoreductase [Chloroflexi bacterium]|nr:Gfo/Idh/MocA family oxidoreductase [Chloroflexota bacterium]
MTTHHRLRIGLIGANPTYGWAPRAHIPAIQALPQAELYAVCTAHEDTAHASAQKFGVELAYHNHHQMLANAQVEAVGVIVRVPKHYQLTMDALAAGKHVYTEWPLGANLKEAQEMADLARKMKVRTMVGLQGRASPVHLRLKELVDEGYVGQVLSVHLDQINAGALVRTSDRTWQRDASLGANTLTIAFGHAIDAVCMALGEFAEVSAVVTTQVPQWYESDTQRYVDVTSPDNILVSGRLQGGAVVSAHVASIPAHGSAYRLEVYGAEGTLALTGGGSAQIDSLRILGGKKDDRALQELPIPDRLKWVPAQVQQGAPYHVAQMWARFAQAIRTNQRPEPDFDTAVQRHKLLDAIQRASDTGRRQTVEG